ncbi:MAG: HesA/MoeB/ThiF family protein [Deltaproteobacteria bacterium]|nr:HesA/MoeB/ThiF family protein [Deltaproteobacteria bacterium]
MDTHQIALLKESIESKSIEIQDPADREVRVLKERDALALSQQYDAHLSKIYIEALKINICPYRYLRNRESISINEQLKLAQSKVSVIGSGGLGGSIILILARLGIGGLVIIDHDVFDETNLNRQAISSTAVLGISKCEEAERMVKNINPGIIITSHNKKLKPNTAVEVLEGCHVAVDALDNIADRFILEKAVKTLNIPMVHGAVAGFSGQVMTIFPEDNGLEAIYGKQPARTTDSDRPEALMGVPAVTPSIIASYQAMEVVKILLNKGNLFRNCLLYIDLESGQLDRLSFKIN